MPDKMELSIEKIERENKFIAGGTTILFGALILLLLFLGSMTSPIPPFEESGMGIEVALGLDDFGAGDDPAPPPSDNASKNEKPSVPSEAAAETKMLTSEVSENVTATDVKNETPELKKVEEPKPDQNLLNALNKQHTTAGNGTGHGDDDTEGWKGDPRGNPNSNVYSKGGGTGLDPKFVLKGSGRKMIRDIAIYDNSQETGIVAVEILVDRYGKIIKADPVLIGSTTTSSVLWKKAKEGLMNQKLFNESASGEDARGTIYINFTVR